MAAVGGGSRLLDGRAGRAFPIRPQQHHAVAVAGGQQHALGLLAAEHDLLEVVEHDDLPADEFLRRVMPADAGHDLLRTLAGVDLQQVVDAGQFISAFLKRKAASRAGNAIAAKRNASPSIASGRTP